MNSNLIERYVHEVTRRLPEGEREEVSRELTSNIMDMLPENPSEEEIAAVLNGLGDPAALSEKYRQKPRYLISPAMFEPYIRTLKIVLPIAGVVCFILGLLIGAAEMVKADANNMVNVIADIISNSLAEGISLGVEAVIQALFFTTLAFVIADYAGVKMREKEEMWTVKKLPARQTENGKGGKPISLSSSIVDLVATVVLSGLTILVCAGTIYLPFVFIEGQNVLSPAIFAASFLQACIPVIIITALFGVVEAVAKIVLRRRCAVVCAAVIANSIAGLGGTLYLLTRPQILSTEFVSFIKNSAIEWGSADLMNLIASGNANAVANAILFLTGAAAVLAVTIECISEIVKTIKK
jgi:hypothetical protein